ncbi:phospholipase A [Helicobacter bilis]|uniref:Phosphatidylcholine 1-acylhydrolase n=1 Tax=Helicobacter bilis TaxID=37372 RepID=A0A4U8U8E2_9HELI|nr:phospholipase A [Helicobacter bilis]MCI7412112.1 phospholipase A [Helicobacter bilis]MDD7296475.1 phospholipase A [Helicobacter bilis]MDY4399580.1 phospholipase A [Helicobacter bilis]TLE10387.1 phospholipase [Helicobacter bilis]
MRIVKYAFYCCVLTYHVIQAHANDNFTPWITSQNQLYIMGNMGSLDSKNHHTKQSEVSKDLESKKDFSPTAQNDKIPESTQENTTLTKLKNHFFDIDTYKERTKEAETTYTDFMRVLEHEGTYFVYSYSLPPFGIYGSNMPSELKFQVSFKVPLWRGAFWSKGSLFFAYTQTSWFQQFNFRYSNPVRDSNYKPSIFYSYPADWELFGGKGGKIKELRIGYLHFSNGIGGDECLIDNNRNPLTPEKCRSRSMGNRIMLELIWEKVMKNSTFGIHITAWPYIPKRKDNPDISLYMGYANARLYYKHKKHFVELHVAPIISDYTRYHGSLQLGYAYEVSKFFAVYGQYFYGYANSLYEYNIPAHRIGIGIRTTGF